MALYQDCFFLRLFLKISFAFQVVPVSLLLLSFSQPTPSSFNERPGATWASWYRCTRPTCWRAPGVSESWSPPSWIVSLGADGAVSLVFLLGGCGWNPPKLRECCVHLSTPLSSEATQFLMFTRVPELGATFILEATTFDFGVEGVYSISKHSCFLQFSSLVSSVSFLYGYW